MSTVKRNKVMAQVLYHGKGHLGIDSYEQADIQTSLGKDLDISFLPSVQLQKKRMGVHHAFIDATVLIIVGTLSYHFLKGFAQGLGEEFGRGLGKALKELGWKLWHGRKSKAYKLNCGLVYLFTYKDVDCAIRIGIPPGQTTEEVSGGLDKAFGQASEHLKELMHFIDENLDIAQSSKDDLIPVFATSTKLDKKGRVHWTIYTEPKRTTFYRHY
jgi:hypothetical protein